MSIEQRRSPRLIDYLPVEVYAVKARGGQPLAGPFSGRIIDMSAHGACLLMTQVFHHGFHIFHSSRDTADTLLQLRILDLPELDPCPLLAVPVWLDLFRQQKIRAFKMGIEFINGPEAQAMKEVQRVLKKNQPQRAGWWQVHCRGWGQKD